MACLGYSEATLSRKAAKRGISVNEYITRIQQAKVRQRENRQERAAQREAAKHKRREKGE